MKPLLLLTLAASFGLTGCATTHNHGAPISSSIRNKDGTLVMVFRNTGKQIVSFDYTIADRANVPHVDADGPNSGLVENLYPGAEKEVANPLQKSIVHTNIGTVTFGKRTADELTQVYRPGAPAGGISGEPTLMPSVQTSTSAAMPTAVAAM